MNTLFTHNKSRTRAEKCLITLLIDVSGSMNEKNSNGNSRLDLIKESLEILLADEQSPKYSAKSSLLAISNFRIAGELAIGLFSSRFGNGIKWMKLGFDASTHPFYSIGNLRSDITNEVIITDGATPLAEATLESLECIENRYQTIKSAHLNLKRPNLFIITDGNQYPQNDSLIRTVRQKIFDMEEKKHLLAYGISIFEEDKRDVKRLVRDEATYILGSNTTIASLIKLVSVTFRFGQTISSDESPQQVHKRIRNSIIYDENKSNGENNTNFFDSFFTIK